MKNEVLRCENLQKNDRQNPVLDNIGFSLYEKETLGLIGFGDAGHSVLAKALAGISKIDSGEIFLKGESIRINSVLAANNAGIFYIGQRTNLFMDVTIAENICIRPLARYGGWRVNYKLMASITKDIFEKIGARISPNTKAGELTLAQCHIVELARALASKATIIIIEDTAANYNDGEFLVFSRCLEIAKMETSLILIDPNTNKVQKLADRVLAFKSGKIAGVFFKGDPGFAFIEKVLTGDRFRNERISRIDKEAPLLLVAAHIDTKELHDVSFTIRQGEVIGFWNAENKHTWVIDLLLGKSRILCGSISICGKDIDSVSLTKPSIDSAIGYTGDFQRCIFPNLSLRDNLTIAALQYYENPLKIIKANMERFAVSYFFEKTKSGVIPAGKELCLANNTTQLAVSLYKWIFSKKKIIIMDDLFSGIDNTIYNHIFDFIVEAKKRGMGVICTANNPDDLKGVCNKIYVIDAKTLKEDFVDSA
jgi:ABC-type sugar transport system ATPase subunit